MAKLRIIQTRDLKTYEIPDRTGKIEVRENEIEGIPAEELARIKKEMQKYPGLIK